MNGGSGNTMAAFDDDPTDYDLHAALTDAIRRGDVTVEVDFPRINRNNVRGFRTTDIVVPPFIIVVLTIYLSIQLNPIYGALLFAIGGALYWFVLRPKAQAATIVRVRDFAMKDLEAWNEVWRNGGYRLTLVRQPDIKTAGPHEEWQAFVRRYILDPAG